MKQMFSVCKESDDPLGAFCFGEATLQLQPNDFHFRFQLAYAYSDVTGGSAQHDYRDLALFHYLLLVRARAAVEYADNNLGSAYAGLGAPIHAAEQFKAASTRGNALATANVIRQYLNAGFADDAKAWAEAHAPAADEEGHIARALATVHTMRAAESDQIAKTLAGESQHRAALADLAGTPAPRAHFDGEWQFPSAALRFAVNDHQIIGTGESMGYSGKILHRLSASERNGLWRFGMQSRADADPASEVRSYGLFRFLDDGRSALVLEYRPDGSISTYRVSKTGSAAPSGQSGVQPVMA